MDNSLLFGRNPTEKIVSLEVQDESAELFIQQEDGSVKSEFVENRFWILSNKKQRSNWSRLKGDLHYCWGKQFDSRDSWQKARNYLKNEDIFTISDPKESLQVLRGLTYYKGLTPSEISILSFDLETTSLDPSIPEAKILLISNTFRKNGQIVKKLFAYDEYLDEGTLIDAWCQWVCEMDPSILIAHNGNGFDIPYLKVRAEEAGTTLKLGRNGSNLRTNHYESKFRKDGSQDLHYKKHYIYGREIVDTMFLAYSHDTARNYPSYGLKPIIKYEGLEKANRAFYDASQIRFKYKDPEEWEKIKNYCIDDSDDSLALFDLMAPAQFYFANSIPRSFQAITESSTGAPLNSFLIRSYLQKGHSIPKASERSPVKGGISFGIPGIYKNVLKIDLKSAYPSQVLRFKLFDPEKDPEGNFYKMVYHFAYERFDLKKKYKETENNKYFHREQAGKKVINSAYGLMNTPFLNFNNSDIANKITKETRDMIEFSLKWASGKGMEYYQQYMKKEDEENEPI